MKPKFKIGDIVWFFTGQKVPTQGKICSVDVVPDKTDVIYTIGYYKYTNYYTTLRWCSCDAIFKSFNALVKFIKTNALYLIEED